jgi:hypothetical protein
MYAQVEKPNENKSRAATNSVAQKMKDVMCGFGFVDNRPEPASQRLISTQSVLQKMAWAKTRPLGEEELTRPLTRDQANPPENMEDKDLEGTLHKWHEHIVFDRTQAHLGGNDNIGFHSSGNPVKGPGELFAEDVGAHTYSIHQQLSHNEKEDGVLIKAMHKNDPPGDYNVLTHNCQDWVKAVTQTFYGYQEHPELEPLLDKNVNAVRH